MKADRASKKVKLTQEESSAAMEDVLQETKETVQKAKKKLSNTQQYTKELSQKAREAEAKASALQSELEEMIGIVKEAVARREELEWELVVHSMNESAKTTSVCDTPKAEPKFVSGRSALAMEIYIK